MPVTPLALRGAVSRQVDGTIRDKSEVEPFVKSFCVTAKDVIDAQDQMCVSRDSRRVC